MSGDLIGEFKGKITGYRVAEILMNGPEVEVSSSRPSATRGRCFRHGNILVHDDSTGCHDGEGQGVARSMSGGMTVTARPERRR
jgi:hypothetical protein